MAAMAFQACSSDDEPDGGISVIKDSQTPENALDRWLMKNYVEPYNVEQRYRWEDNEISMDYILVPATMKNSIRMARLLKYICFDSFDEVTGSTKFIHDNFPKQIQLVGNPGWNSNGSVTLGSSEGGYKIKLWYVNHLGDQPYDENWQLKDSVIYDREELNNTYFHTIIHEFGHTFHQKVPYTSEFNQVTGTNYLGGMWFQTKLDKAGTAGKAKIQQKLRIVREYFRDNWYLDIDALRDAVQRREADLKSQNFDDISL